LHLLQLAERAQVVAEAALADGDAGRARIGASEHVRDLLDGEAVALEAPGIDIDVDLALETAGHGRLGHAVDLLEPALEHRLRHVLERPERAVAGDTQRHDRLAPRIGAQHQRAGGLLGQGAPDPVQPLPHVEGGEVHVRAPREAERHQGHALAGRALQPLHARHVGQRPLHRLGHEALDFRGRDVRVAGVDDQARIGNVRKQVDGEASEREPAERRDRHEQHGDRDRPPDRSAGK
jgi:hypothetical protein